jgi:hypothetical protein
VLYEQRKRFKERAEAEAQGQCFWTESFAENVRLRIL